MEIVIRKINYPSKHLPPIQETWVQSLGREDLLEKEMATHSSTLAWKIPWTEEPGRATIHGVAKSWTRLSDFTFLITKVDIPFKSQRLYFTPTSLQSGTYFIMHIYLPCRILTEPTLGHKYES